MKREKEDELKMNKGAPSIFFMDLSTMSRAGSALYILAIIAFFAVIFYVLSVKLLNKPVDLNKKKREERNSKRASKGGKSQ